jgi:hypothetical protein
MAIVKEASSSIAMQTRSRNSRNWNRRGEQVGPLRRSVRLFDVVG